MHAFRRILPVAMLALTPVFAQAQSVLPLSLEVRGGAASATGDWSEGLKTGFGFGLNAGWSVMPMVELYAGYSHSQYGVEEFSSVNVSDAGFALGARVAVPAVPVLAPWVRGGVVYNQIEISATEDGVSESFKSDRAVGYEVGGGIAWPLAPRFSLTPGVTYRQHTPKYEGESAETSAGGLSFDVGLRFRF